MFSFLRITSRSSLYFNFNKRFYSSLDEEIFKVRLSVLGVGGAGCNAVNTMIQNKELTDLEFYVANTDAQSLLVSSCNENDRIQIGRELTKCLGAGANPKIGKQAAEDDIKHITDKIGDTNMCFITAGMGGGTGTGAAPVIGKALRDKGILTIGMVCMPFGFEGRRKMNLALEGINEMKQAVDTLIIVQNERLLKTLNRNAHKKQRVSLKDSFKMVDDIFHEGIKAVTDVIVKPGLINLDFADVKTITEGPGWGIMGSGYAEGHGKAETATREALNNPLLSDTSIANASGVLVSITGGPDLAILEVDEVLRLIREEVSPDANVIFGATTDTNMKGAIRVSLILTGPYDNETAMPKESLHNNPQETISRMNNLPPVTPPSNTTKSSYDNQPRNTRPSKVYQVSSHDETSNNNNNETKKEESKPSKTYNIPKPQKPTDKSERWWLGKWL